MKLKILCLAVFVICSLGITSCSDESDGDVSSGSTGFDESKVLTITNIGPSDGFSGSFAFHPVNTNVIWFSGDDGGGIYKSTNDGDSWILSGNMPSNQSSYSLMIDQVNTDIIYAPNHFGRGFLKSTNGGVTWRYAGAGLPVDPADHEDKRFNDLAIDLTNNNILYGCTGEGLFKSIDYGETFSLLPASQVSNDDVTQDSGFTCEVVTVSQTGSSAGDIFVGIKEGGIYKSTDQGVNWSICVTDAAGSLPVTALETTDHALYMAMNTGVMFKSTVFCGITNVINSTPDFVSSLWTKLQVVTGANATSDILYAGSTVTDGVAINYGFYYSNDSGDSFSKPSSDLGNFSIQALALDPNDSNRLMLGTAGGGIFKTINAGVSWTAVNTGTIGSISTAFAVDPTDDNHLLAGGSVGLLDENGGFYESSNGGVSWNRVSALPADPVALSISFNNPNTVLAGGYRNGIYRTTSGVNSGWAVVNTMNVPVSRFVRDKVNNNKIYACAHNLGFFNSDVHTQSEVGVYYSDNDGATWSKRTLIPDPSVSGHYVVSHPTNEDEAVAIGYTELYTTMDAFSSTPNTVTFPGTAGGHYPLSGAFDPSNPSKFIIGTSDGMLYISNDFNLTGSPMNWSELNSPAKDSWIRSIEISDNGKFWIATLWLADVFYSSQTTEGYMFSNDSGITWRLGTDYMTGRRLTWDVYRSSQNPDRFYLGMWGTGLNRVDLVN